MYACVHEYVYAYVYMNMHIYTHYSNCSDSKEPSKQAYICAKKPSVPIKESYTYANGP